MDKKPFFKSQKSKNLKNSPRRLKAPRTAAKSRGEEKKFLLKTMTLLSQAVPYLFQNRP
jgi:uncharacterized protein with GYD domain